MFEVKGASEQQVVFVLVFLDDDYLHLVPLHEGHYLQMALLVVEIGFGF